MAESLLPAEVELTVVQGADQYAVVELYQDEENTLWVDLTGCIFDMDVRPATADSEAVAALRFTNRSSGEGASSIVFGGRDSNGDFDPAAAPDATSGIIRINFASAVTSAITLPKPPKKLTDRIHYPFVYDLEMIDAGGRITRLMSGFFYLDLEVTRRV